LPDGGWLFATQGGSWGAIGADGSLRHRQDALSADLAGAARLQLADGGRRVRFSLRWWPEEARVFSLPQGSLGPDEIGLTPPLAGMTDRFRIEDWQDKPNTRLNGVALAGSWPDEKSFSLAIAPDARHFALGSQFQLRLFDRQGRLVWRVLAPGVARAVNIASGSDLVVAAFGDGTIRWYRLVDGTELLALLPLKDGQRWIAWTPEGFYASSGPDAEALMGYHLNRGRDREGRFVNARQLRAQFYQPTLIAHRLDADGDALLANAVAHLGDVRTLLAGTSAAPPQVELLSPAELTSEGEVTVTVRVTDQGGGIGPLRFYIDGKPQSGRQGGSTAGTEIRSFSLEPGRRGIEVAGTSRGGVEGPRQAVLATVTGPSQEAALHVLAVGVQHYAPPEPELKHSAADATRFAQELAAHAKPLFRRGVFVAPVLVDPQATLDGIEQAFQALRAGIRPQDTLVIFLAGHGEAPLGRGYTFLPSGFRRGAQGDAGKGIDEQRLLGWLAQSPGRHTLLLLDTCDAGGAVAMIEGGYQRLSTLSQQVVIGASRRGQFAQEGVDGHGVFTAALLRVLNARQPDGADPVLRVARLRDDVESEVGRIVRSLGPYRQQVSGFLGSANFPLALR
jgi:hypothetical protein